MMSISTLSVLLPDSDGGGEDVSEGDDGEDRDEFLQAQRRVDLSGAERLPLLHPLA